MPNYHSQYIRDVHQACSQMGSCRYMSALATLRQAQIVMDQAKDMRDEATAMDIPVALWCEYQPAQHSFSSKDGHVRIQRQVYDGAMQQKQHDALVYCTSHALDAGLLPDPKAAITNGDSEPVDGDWSP